MNGCVWTYNEDGFYDTGCDNAFFFTYSRMQEGFKYCPYCGLEIKNGVAVPVGDFSVDPDRDTLD
jgi:hypothetical protein